MVSQLAYAFLHNTTKKTRVLFLFSHHAFLRLKEFTQYKEVVNKNSFISVSKQEWRSHCSDNDSWIVRRVVKSGSMHMKIWL